jgi:hypothetical protein
VQRDRLRERGDRRIGSLREQLDLAREHRGVDVLGVARLYAPELLAGACELASTAASAASASASSLSSTLRSTDSSSDLACASAAESRPKRTLLAWTT